MSEKRDGAIRTALDAACNVAERRTVYKNNHGNNMPPQEVLESALSAAGYAIVPREPTEGMQEAGDYEMEGNASEIYRAMIAKAEEE